MKIKVIFFATLCMAFTACNSSLDNKKVGEKNADAVEMIDAESSNHLTFKGVPIDGTLKQFVKKMKKAGFSYVGKRDGIAVLQGDFAGYKDCKVYVTTLDGNDVVSFISIAFPSQDTWEYLYGDYKRLKELLTEKYGQPSSVKEEFQGLTYSSMTDNVKVLKVKDDECKYETRFTTEKGEIVLWIEHGGFLSMSTYVCLQYKDSINSNAVKQQAINDL